MTYQSTSQTDQGAAEEDSAELVSFSEEDAELRLILVGKSGGGKSATGNTILGRKEFKSIAEANTTTVQCQKGQRAWQGMTIFVVDTPAIFDSKGHNEIMQREIMACKELAQPGPHALILVTQVGRFTTEDATAAKCVWDIFGAESARHTIVLFTCVEDLGGYPLQDYVQRSKNRNLQEVIQRCGNRVCGFNNKAEGVEQERQVSELVEMVQRTVLANGGGYYRLYKMPNVRDEHVKAKNETGRERAAWRPWSSINIVTLAAFCFLFVAIVIAIILLVRFM